MKNVNLYNQDGSLSPEAQFLLSPKPDDMSIAERRKIVKELKSLLSAEDLKQLGKLEKNKMAAKHRAIKRELRKLEMQQRVSNTEKVNLYNPDGSLHAEAQLIIAAALKSPSTKEDLRSARKLLKNFEVKLSEADIKEIRKLKEK